MPSLSTLLVLVRERVPESLLSGAIVMGSAAIALRGVALGREPGDIDLFVSRAALDAWPATGFERDTKNGDPRIAVVGTDLVEIFADFAGVTFEAVDEHAGVTDGSQGVRVAALSDLLTWKRALAKLRTDEAHRTKDLRDIRAIEEHLNRRI